MSGGKRAQNLPEIYEQDVPALGLRTAGDQLDLYSERLVAVGVGGAGGVVAVSQARNGMRITVADPDTFDPSNIGRQTGAYLDTIGENKAEVIGALIRRIRGEEADTRVFNEGLTYENVDKILEDATLVLDAIDIARPDLSILLGRKARQAGLPVFTGIEKGDGCELTVFDPNADENGTIEHYFGIEVDEPVDPNLQIEVMQYLAHLPSYTPPGMLEAFMTGELPSTPAISAGVLNLGGAMTTAMDRYLFGVANNDPKLIYPNIYITDPVDGMKVVHADKREEHLTESLERIGTTRIGHGFSLPEEYKVI